MEDCGRGSKSKYSNWKVWGIQKEVFIELLKGLLKGNDCFVCQPTGSGKSLLLQAWPFVKLYFEKQQQQNNKQVHKKKLASEVENSLKKQQVYKWKKMFANVILERIWSTSSSLMDSYVI